MADNLERWAKLFEAIYVNRSVFAPLFFGIGIFATIYLLRRTRPRMPKAYRDREQALHRRKVHATRVIEGISARQWLDKRRNSMQFSRLKPMPSSSQLAYLASITRYQNAAIYRGSTGGSDG